MLAVVTVASAFIIVTTILLLQLLLLSFLSQPLFATATKVLDQNSKNDHDISTIIVAYYQTSGVPCLASAFAMTLFRRVYPNASLYIHYFDMPQSWAKSSASLLWGTRYKPTLATAGGAAAAAKKQHNQGMYFNTTAAAEAYIARLQTAAALRPRGWVLLMEDDVWCWRAPRRDALVFDITGRCRAVYRQEYAKVLHRACYGGYGGHFVNSSRLLGLQTQQTSTIISALLKAHAPIASDELLSAVILRNGGSIGEYDGYYEPFTTGGSGDWITMHQMKLLYPWFKS